MTIFVTGGTGFVGSHFLRAASAAGYRIKALRRSTSVSRIPPPSEIEWVDKALGEVHEADFAGCEVLVHLAAHSANVPYDTLEACMVANVMQTLLMHEIALRAGIRRFLVAGSCFEYGRAAERFELIPVDAPLEPVGTYPISKAAASVALSGFARERGVEMTILRIFQAYGEGEATARFWPSLRRAALEGRDFPMSPGQQVRDFVPVEDVARQFASHIEFNAPRGQPVVCHVASGKAQTVLQFAEEQWRHFGASGQLLPGKLPYRAGEIMRVVPQLSK